MKAETPGEVDWVFSGVSEPTPRMVMMFSVPAVLVISRLGTVALRSETTVVKDRSRATFDTAVMA